MPTENSSCPVLSPYLCLELVGHGCDCSGDQSSNLLDDGVSGSGSSIWEHSFHWERCSPKNYCWPATLSRKPSKLGKIYPLHGLCTKYIFLWKLFTEREMRKLFLCQLMGNNRKNVVRWYKECCSYFRKIQTRNAFANLLI